MLFLLSSLALRLTRAQNLNYDCQPTVGGVFFDYTPLKRSGSGYVGTDTDGARYELNICGVISDGKSCGAAGGSMCQIATDGSTIVIASGTSGAAPTYSLIDQRNPQSGLKLSFDNEPRPPAVPCFPMGLYRKATITLQCVPGAHIPTTPLQVTESSTCNYQVILPSKYGCPAPVGGWPKFADDEGGLSSGSVLLILIIPGAALYFVIGFLYKSKTQGTSGVESIPNIDFWRSLPQLVKEGIRFTMRGCKAGGGQGDAGYDEL
eukprot:gb/GEZN01014300.1/.p1 GENE.gb/GEZN01014300.1/~~gb/GEZN01014300.1/.p1  ORF type:complete len:289 (+),score=18.62 gb/GEZN01014300.1/:81-869(+)